MTNLYVCVGLLLSQTSQAVFARTYGMGGEEGGGYVSLVKGGYALVGYTKSYGAGEMDILLVRTDTAGNLIWAKTYGGPQNECPNDMLYIPDTGFIVSGWTYSFGQGLSELLVMRLDTSGNLVWAKTFGGPMMDTVCYVTRLANGNIGLLGMTQSYGMDENFDLLVMSLDLSGNPLWTRVFGGPLHDYAASMASSSDGGLIVAGDGYSSGFGHIFVVKLRADGTTEWATSINESGLDWPYSAIQTYDAGFALAGYTTSYGQGQQDFLLVRLDSNGNLKWAKAYGGADYDRPYALIQTSDSGYAIAGMTWSFGTLCEAMLIKTDTGGNLAWARTFGGDMFDYGFSASQEPNGFYVLSGVTMSFGVGSFDAFLLRLDENGNYGGCVEGCSPGVVEPSLTTSSPPDGGSCTPTETSPSLAVGEPTLSVRDACGPPLYEGVNDGSGGERGVLCIPGKGFTLFILRKPTALKIYSADGSLVYSGHLRPGRNRIPLGPGVYLWTTGEQTGKSTVR